VRRERLAKTRDVDRRDEEVGVLRLDPEQRVADRSPDHVRVQPERPDVLLDRLR
jgi:hypothetical protein